MPLISHDVAASGTRFCFFHLAAKNSEERRTMRAMRERPKVPMLNADFSHSEQRTPVHTIVCRCDNTENDS